VGIAFDKPTVKVDKSKEEIITPSCMSRSCGEGEDDEGAAGLFGRVADIMNTAKDIAYVIWNVGWTRWSPIGLSIYIKSEVGL
jgi:hypothetical protein